MQVVDQGVLVSSGSIHAMRQKLQLIIAVAEGPNDFIIIRAVKEIGDLLPPFKSSVTDQ